jgi:hypothetical protein
MSLEVIGNASELAKWNLLSHPVLPSPDSQRAGPHDRSGAHQPA